MKINQTEELYKLLEEKVQEYNSPKFIEADPISIPHQFDRKEDIEIAGFLVAIIAWGQRKTILNNGEKLLQMMEYSPYDFIVNHSKKDLKAAKTFVHRTFNGIDLCFFLSQLQRIYKEQGGLEAAFCNSKTLSVKEKIAHFKEQFFQAPHELRTTKHLADPNKGSTAKRLNMFLRWMVRNDNVGVDFGIWKGIDTKDLMLPLDVHTGNVGRQLGLLTRKQNDWRAVEEITKNLRKFDPIDPVKYDFALFGMGVNGVLE